MSKNIKILVVDDEKNWRDLIKEILGKERYDITTAASGDEAIELIKKDEYQIIVTDMRMESEFRGIELLEYIKKECPTTPVIILTAHATIQIATDSIKKGAFYFLAKGASNEELRKKVTEALKQRKKDENKNFDEMVLQRYPCFFSEIYHELKSALAPMEKFKRQIDLFEVMLKFFSFVVISEYVSGQKRIPDIDSRLIGGKTDAPVLGDWFNMSNEIYKMKKEFPDLFYLDKFSTFFRGKNRKLMQDFIEIRNTKWGHGPKISDFEYNNLVTRCNDIILTLLNDLKFLKDSLLCNIIHLKIKKDQKKYKLIECTGANSKLLPSEKIFETYLPCEEMILLHLKNERYQTLHPFIILENCKKCDQPEIFVFSKLSRNKIHYVSYKTGHEFFSDTYMESFFKLIKGENC